MKFSGSLLEDKDIGIKIFNNSLNKCKTLLKDIFGLNFEGEDPNIINVNEDTKNYNFSVVFNINNREIIANFNYEAEESSNNMVIEILNIKEPCIEIVELLSPETKGMDDKENFFSNLNKVQDYLERNFEINFTPLDPDEKDENINSVNLDEKSLSWNARLTQDYNEGYYEVIYRYLPEQAQHFIINHYNHHKIFLD